MTLERLIGDGRIHPARIEETVEKCRHDLELQMKREGERAVMELGIHGLHPDLIKLIGRLKYRTCLLYTSDAADEEDSGDLGGRRILKKKKRTTQGD